MADEWCANKDSLLLEKCPNDKLEKVVHGLLDIICHNNSLKYEDYKDIWDITEWKLLTKCWTSCLESFIGNNLTLEQIKTNLKNENIAEETQKVVVECVGARKEEIRLHLIDVTCALSKANLKDFDWKLKLLMASDKIANLRQPVVSLDFDIEHEEDKKHVSVELTKEELKELISTLETANRTVQQLKS